MRKLIGLLRKHSFFIQFLIFEFIALSIVFSYSGYHRIKCLNSSAVVISSVYDAFDHIDETFSLRLDNKELAYRSDSLLQVLKQKELKMEQLSSQLSLLLEESATLPDSVNSDNLGSDSLRGESLEVFDYIYRSARVIKNSVNLENNSIIIDLGEEDGIKPDMAVLSNNSVVGVVSYCSTSYSKVVSLLSRQLTVSAKIKRSDFAGVVTWDGAYADTINLKDISYHVSLDRGDTVVTSGFSSIFPPAVNIGTVERYLDSGDGNFYDVFIVPSVDFRSLNFVDIVQFKGREEILKLEEL